MGIILPTNPGGKYLSTVDPFRPENKRPCSAHENAPNKREGAESEPRLNACTVGETKECFAAEKSQASSNPTPFPVCDG